MNSAVFQTGIIDVGAHTVRLEIFEVGETGDYQILESLTRASRLGTDVFRSGFVSPESADAFSAVMCDYAAILREYGIQKVRAFATSAIREAGNRDLIIDRIRHDSGIELEIMESAAEIELVYLSMKEQLQQFELSEEEPIIAVVIGSGSLFVILLRKGELKFCEEIPLGTDRFSGLFGSDKVTSVQFFEELRALDIPQRLAESAGFLPGESVHFITMGAAPRLVAGEKHSNVLMNTGDVKAMIAEFMDIPVSQIADSFGISADDAAAGVGAAVMLECFQKLFNCKEFICLSRSTREAAVAHMIRMERTPGIEPFRDDLRSLCYAIGNKYGFDAVHAGVVAGTSLKILETLREGFNFPPRSEMLLEVAAPLHDIGRFVDTRDHNLHSCYLISATQLPGLTPAEHRIVALIAGAHRGNVDSFLSGTDNLFPEHRVLVLKLAAVLRAADALDCAREGKFRNISMSRSGVVLEFMGSGGDFYSESRELELKGGLFSKVFGMKVRIQEG